MDTKPLREEPRAPAVIPVRIYGLDAAGKPFNSVAHTLNVSKSGALLANVEVALSVNDVIGVQRGVYKGKFRVQWVGKKGTSSQGQVGIESAEGPRNIWGLDERPHSLVKEQDAAQHRTFVGGGFEKERRSAVRHSCELALQVCQDNLEMKLWSRCTDISETGCYIETACPLPPLTNLHVTIFLDADTLHVPAEVRTCFPNMGMGVQFLFESEDQAVILRRFLRQKFAIQGVPDEATAAQKFSALEKLSECVEQLKAWAHSTEMNAQDREEMEELANSVRQDLQGIRAELSRRQMMRNAQTVVRETSA